MADCIGEINHPIDVDKLTFQFKLNWFLKHLQLNPNVTRNSVHISLNFVPSEADLSKKTLVHIAERYMQKIGFGDQPFLIYQHLDAGHPHLHIVSVNVRADASRINMFHLGGPPSIAACREIEKEFNLVVAKKREKTQRIRIESTAMSKISYGKNPVTTSLSHILHSLLEQYHYTNLSELNALLRQYNILADRGLDGSKMFKKRGLVYRILGANGKAIGSYVRASDLYIKATLKVLEQRFKENEIKRLPFKSRIQHIINKTLMGNMTSLAVFVEELEKHGIHVAILRNDTSLVQSITYVDHQTKCVFTGTDLGKPYHAETIQKRCWPPQVSRSALPCSAETEKAFLPRIREIESKDSETGATHSLPEKGDQTLLNTLPQNDQAFEDVQRRHKNNRRKKKIE